MARGLKGYQNSVEVGRYALRMALTASREEENRLKEKLEARGIRATAVDFGGEFPQSVAKIIERAVVAAQRQHLVNESHVGAGSVAGAAHDALTQVKLKAIGFNVGGKIGLARMGEHICVGIYMGVGLLNLNEMCVGVGHRSVSEEMQEEQSESE